MLRCLMARYAECAYLRLRPLPLFLDPPRFIRLTLRILASLVGVAMAPSSPRQCRAAARTIDLFFSSLSTLTSNGYFRTRYSVLLCAMLPWRNARHG
ncbi:hypothetical protein BDZ89DRAFT_552108 [Hymenopellis radicata]|nr:hypothetical protein BDZ89DRAFT_552108 [Hymenopellis radicata]